MSFQRMFLAAVAAVALASPVFADETAAAGTDAQQVVAQADTATPAATEAQQVSDTTATTDATPAATTTDKVNVNKATAKELMKIKGLTASKARAIVAYRKKHGDFKSTEELSNVKGFKKVKPDTLKQIEDQLSVE